MLDKLDTEYADSIRAAQGTDTIKTVMVIDGELAQAGTVSFKAIMDYIDAYSDRDDVPDSAYTAVRYMLTLDDKEFHKLAIGTAASLDTLEWSREQLDTLLLENREDSAFYAWQNLTLRGDGKGWHQLSAGQLAVEQAMASGTTHMRGHTEAVLGLLSDSAIVRWPELPALRCPAALCTLQTHIDKDYTHMPAQRGSTSISSLATSCLVRSWALSKRINLECGQCFWWSRVAHLGRITLSCRPNTRCSPMA